MYSMYLPSLVTTSGAVDLGKSISGSITLHCQKDSYLSGISIKIMNTIQTIEHLQGRSRANPHTEHLAELRKKRLSLASGSKDLFDSKQKFVSLDPIGAEAAEKLNRLFAETAIDTNASYLVISNQTDTRLKRLDTPENRALMEKIGYLPIFNEYKAVQAEIDKVSNEKDSAESEKTRGTVDDVVQELKNSIGYILPYLESQSAAFPEQYALSAKEIRESVIRVMSSMKSSRGRKGGSEDQSENGKLAE